MKEMLTIELPDGLHFNCGVTIDHKYLISNNNGSPFKEIKIPLPKGKWSIYSNPLGNKIILQNNE